MRASEKGLAENLWPNGQDVEIGGNLVLGHHRREFRHGGPLAVAREDEQTFETVQTVHKRKRCANGALIIPPGERNTAAE